MTQQQFTITGPRGYRLIVDLEEVCPDDPGNGTPFIVENPSGENSTFACALDTGACDDTPFPTIVSTWLEGLEDSLDRYWDSKVAELEEKTLNN